jgi:hypothetical protein
MLVKNNKPQLKKKGDNVSTTKWRKPPTFGSWALMSPAERGGVVLEQMMRELRLFEEYGITDLRGFDFHSPWRKLALALAERYEGDFKSRSPGRPKKHEDDPELVLMVELLRRRDGLTIAHACKMIIEKGVFSSKPNSLYERYKTLMKRRHWRVILEGFEKISGNRYVETLEETFGAKLK